MEPTKVEGVDNIRSSDALKETSNNPLLIAQSDADPSSQKADAANGPSSLQSERAKALRSSITSLPDNALFVQFDALALSTPDSNGTGGSTSQAVQDATDVDLPALFPELQTYGFIDFNPSEIVASSSSSEGKKKGDKRRIGKIRPRGWTKLWSRSFIQPGSSCTTNQPWSALCSLRANGVKGNGSTLRSHL